MRLKLDQEYKAKITHIDGDLNTGGDGMSRLMKLLKIPPKIIEEVMSIDNLN